MTMIPPERRKRILQAKAAELAELRALLKRFLDKNPDRKDVRLLAYCIAGETPEEMGSIGFSRIAGEFWHMRQTMKEPVALNDTPRPEWITDKMIEDMRAQFNLCLAVPVELTEQEAITALTDISRLIGVIPTDQPEAEPESPSEAISHE